MRRQEQLAGIDIEVKPVVITKGDITIKVEPTNSFSKDSLDLGDGTGLDLNRNLIYVKKNKVTVANIVRALNKLGTNAKDIISILEALKKAGAIKAELEVI